MQEIANAVDFVLIGGSVCGELFTKYSPLTQLCRTRYLPGDIDRDARYIQVCSKPWGHPCTGGFDTKPGVRDLDLFFIATSFVH